MFVTTVIVSIVLGLVVIGSAAGKLTRQPSVVDMLATLDVPEAWLPRLAAAEIAGGVGLLVGLAVPAIGIAGAVGLVAYFVGAVITHRRAGDDQFVPPAVLAVLALVALVLRIASM